MTPFMNNDLQQKSYRPPCLDWYLKSMLLKKRLVNVMINLTGCFLRTRTKIFALQATQVALFYNI